MKLFRFCPVFLLILMLALPVFSQQVINPADGMILENDYARYVFEPVGMGLTEMTDKSTTFQHIEDIGEDPLLWQVVFGGGTMRPSIDNNYKPCSYASLEELTNGDKIAIMEWNDVRFWEEDSIINVKVTVRLPHDSGIARWGISVSNWSDYWGIWEVACPAVKGFPAPEKYDIAIPVTGTGGHLLKNWSGTFKKRSPSGFFPMQFMAFSNGSNSIFFSSMDGESRAKDFYFDSEIQELSLIRYTENMGVAGSDLPERYSVAFGPYQGGWLEAAYMYRDWAMKQVWTSKGPISQRPEFPEIATNVGFWIRDTWVWDLPPGVDKDTGDPFSWRRDERDPHEMNIPFLEAMEKMDVPMAFQWYGWHQVLFDNHYPHFLPPLKGFKERVTELVDSGALIVPYINALSADSKTWDWDLLDPHAIKDEAGGLRQKFYRDGAGRLTPMCPNQNYWHHRINTVIDSIINYYGANGIYMDEISCNSHELCFNPEHRHPLGGGRYWADGYRDLYRKTLNIAHQNNKEVVVTSESANEIFFDLVTANLFTGRPTDYEIPMLQVVYSGYTLFYASRCDFRDSRLLFNFCVGQGFIDGKQIGWMDFDLFRPEFSEKLEYMKLCAKYRMETKKYLTFGRLWEPIYPNNDICTFTQEFRGGGMHTGQAPKAEARLWQAEDGTVAVFFANYVDEDVSFTYSIYPEKYGLEAGKYLINEISPEGIEPLEESGEEIKRTENLKANRVKVIEFKPLH